MPLSEKTKKFMEMTRRSGNVYGGEYVQTALLNKSFFPAYSC
jgi:hypothetical protein